MNPQVDVLFMTNYCPNYRVELFNYIASHYRTLFVFQEKRENPLGSSFNSLHLRLGLGLVSCVQRSKPIITICSFPEHYSPVIALLSKIMHSKLILWSEEWWMPLTFSRKLLNPAYRWTAKNSILQIVPGSLHEFHMSKFQNRLDRIHVVPNAMPTLKGVGDRSIRCDLGLEHDFVILYLGRLVKYKGIELLLEAYEMAIRKGSKAKLVVCGEGPIGGDLEEFSIKKRLGVIFTGYVPDERKLDYYQIGDILVLPSKIDYQYSEAWGLVINEAMMAGLPVITTNGVGASKDMILPGITGWVIGEGDRDALCNALLSAEINSGDVAKMGSAARDFVHSNFSMEQMCKKFCSFIEDAIQKGISKP